MVKKAFLKTGLTSDEAQENLKTHGPNQLVKKREFSSLKLLFSQFKSPLVYILVLAGIVTLFLKEWTDATVIFAAVAINTALGFYQERKAQRTLAALRSLLAPKAKVIRDGKQQEIDAVNVVPGDLVVLTIGTRVPADGVLVKATDFSLNEAILTGESMAVRKEAVEKIEKAEKEIKRYESKKAIAIAIHLRYVFQLSSKGRFSLDKRSYLDKIIHSAFQKGFMRGYAQLVFSA